ncbi:MAG: hypothetical protein CEE43_04920 [Promethearchaeota archaeon Loki_b32]|nr:MAG: hypothetical protein CEE43_04920 [Candidatus Lokiarchaeota archaeon Loki_b32]
MYLKYKRGVSKISEIEITDKELNKARNSGIAAFIIGLVFLNIIIALRAYSDVGLYVLSIVMCLIPMFVGGAFILTYYLKPDYLKKTLLELKQAKATKKAKKQEEN